LSIIGVGHVIAVARLVGVTPFVLLKEQRQLKKIKDIVNVCSFFVKMPLSKNSNFEIATW
jgi:hypothetical protein